MFSPNIPPGELSISCDIYVANLDSGELRKFNVIKHSEPGYYHQEAWEIAIDSELESDFGDFYNYFTQFNSSSQSVAVASSGISFESAYELVGNTQNQEELHDYIVNNHPLINGIFEITAGFFSVVDASGSNFGGLLTVLVIFPDGSEGVFNIEVIGIGISKWVPVEGTFYDDDGNEIFFEISDYDGQSGSTSGGTTGFLINRLSSGGWGVSISGSGTSCSWSCGGTACSLTCSSQ